MKFTRKVFIYFGGMTGLAIAAILAENTWKEVLMAFVILWQGVAFIYFLWFGRMLDGGIEKLDDIDRFTEHFQGTKEATFRRLVQKEGEFSSGIEAHFNAKVEDKQSKINSLQSQINPHFLYNTLECIRSEAVSRRNESIANMAKALASFFRYSISKKENMVTILDELNNIRNYIMIQNYRFEDKFRFEVKLEDEDSRILSYLIPKMTIQPIVENSIYHGLETKSSDCRVRIDIRLTENGIILMVSDNGIGMDENTLIQLREGLKNGVNVKDHEYGGDDDRKNAGGNGIGLYNVNQRIKLIFGPDYGLSVYSTKGIGTDVEIWIPLLEKMHG